ncbi:MAG: protein kinase, partial [bacterium]|nr:protein kinase [bacterium]
KLGEGGMGSVYLARDLTLEREVAIKLIAPELARKPSLMARFRVEAIAQAKLNHSNITAIHSFDQEKDHFYIVMEYVHGKTLKDVIKEKGKMPLQQALKIFSQILSAIAYGHLKGVVHRDIKPSNVFLTEDHIAKIGDFGIAKVEGIEGLTKVGSTLGSPLYCSPEQIAGKKTDARTDVYSLGMTLYEMLTGQLPFKFSKDSDYEMMKQVIETTPPNPSQMEKSIPPAVDAMIMKCLEKLPENRFQSVKEFEEAVKNLMSHRAPAAPAAPAPGKMAPPPPKKEEEVKPAGIKTPGPVSTADRKKVLTVVLVLAIVFVCVVLYLVLSSGTDPAAQPTSGPPTGVTQSNTSQPTNGIPNLMQPEPGKSTTAQQPTAPVTQQPSSSTTQQPFSSSAGDMPGQMDALIKRGNYTSAIGVGEQAVKDGTASAALCRKLAQAYYYDGNKQRARKYYWKVSEYGGAFRFNVYYQYRKKKKISGTLSVSDSALFFQPSRDDLTSLRFSIDISQVKRVNFDYVSDLKGIFKKKKNRKNPMLIIRGRSKQKYSIQLKDQDSKLRSFLKDIIDTMRK